MTENNNNEPNQNNQSPIKPDQDALWRKWNVVAISFILILGNFALFILFIGISHIDNLAVIMGLLMLINAVLGVAVKITKLQSTPFFLCALLWGLLLGGCLTIAIHM